MFAAAHKTHYADPSSFRGIIMLSAWGLALVLASFLFLWLGYLLDELTLDQLSIVELVDVLIDGKFIAEIADPSLVWRGSSNQVIH